MDSLSRKAWQFLLGRVWTLTAGIAAAAVTLLVLGPRAVWILLALALVLALAEQAMRGKSLAARIAPAGSPATAPVLLPQLARVLIENLPTPVMLLDSGLRVLAANAPMRGVLGEGVERKHVSAVMRNPIVLEAVSDSLESGVARSAEFTLPVPIERFFEVHTARMIDSPPTVALLLHDVTAIRRSEQMRADFVANASHELRTPLAAVSGFIDTLRGHAKDDPVARDQFLGIMSVEAARMRRLIDDLLSLTRIELNEHVRPSGRMNLKAVVSEAVAALTPLAAQDGITVTVTGPEGQVNGDHDELVQLFQNLVHNAIKYGRENGQVTVSLGRTTNLAGPQLFAAVKDDGEGIPATAIPRLTERFYRVDVQRSRQKGGTGLGLAIVKHIVNRHHGRLTIESKAGEGSTFTVFLPELTPEIPAKAPASLAVTEML